MLYLESLLNDPTELHDAQSKHTACASDIMMHAMLGETKADWIMLLAP